MELAVIIFEALISVLVFLVLYETYEYQDRSRTVEQFVRRVCVLALIAVLFGIQLFKVVTLLFTYYGGVL